MPEQLCSPVSFLASFLCAEEAPHTLFLISGESAAGKTAWCLQLIQEAPRAGLQPCGLVSPPVFENGEKVGIDLLDVVSG